MYGTFVPTSTGHMPIAFLQPIYYNCFNKKIKPLSIWRRACLQAAERVGILSTAYKSPRAAQANLLPYLINLVVDL
jgi:hypothetical protein